MVGAYFERNHRLRQEGGRVVFDPAIHAVYKPRESFGAVIRQYWQYGRAKGMVLAAAPEIRLRQLAPLALLRMAPVLAAMHLTWSTGVVVALAGAAQQRLWRPPRPTDS